MAINIFWVLGMDMGLGIKIFLVLGMGMGFGIKNFWVLGFGFWVWVGYIYLNPKPKIFLGETSAPNPKMFNYSLKLFLKKFAY